MNACVENPKRWYVKVAVDRWLALIFGLLGLAAASAAPLRAQDAASGKWVVPERRARQKNPVTANEANLQKGRELYLRECSSCHGQTGNNDGPKAPESMANAHKHTDPTLWTETDGALFWKIAEGRGSMPSTRELLTDNERWLIVLYMRTLAPKP